MISSLTRDVNSAEVGQICGLGNWFSSTLDKVVNDGRDEITKGLAEDVGELPWRRQLFLWKQELAQGSRKTISTPVHSPGALKDTYYRTRLVTSTPHQTLGDLAKIHGPI